MSYLGLAFLLLAAIRPVFAAEADETVRAAYADYLQGRLEEAAKGYRYLSVLGLTSPAPDLNLAVLSRDMGKHEEALPLWVKSSLLDNAGGFVWNQRAWSYLSMNRTSEAKDSFLKAIEKSSMTATQAEANLGLGMMALLDSRPKAAMAPLRDALVQGPYVLPAAAYQTALTALRMGEKQAALAYLRQSINQDPQNLEVLKTIAELYKKIGENLSAWRVYHMILSLDPADEDVVKNINKTAKYIVADPQTLLPVRRLLRPLLNESGKGALDPPKSRETVRVAIFSGIDDNPATVLRAYFMSNSAFRLVSASGEVIKDDGKGFDQWEIRFRPENNIVEVRDTAHNIQYTSKQPFRIVPSSVHGSVLIKSAEFIEKFGFDTGDRELRGVVEFIPTPYGFKVVNELPIESYLYGVVAAALPQGSPIEAYKAQAVVSRTKTLWHKALGRPSMERSDICDSAHCQKYMGLNEEMLDATRAVGATEGVVLKLNGQPANVFQHENCGGITENARDSSEKYADHLVSVHDGPTPTVIGSSPIDLERWTHEYPPGDRYCEASSLAQAAQARWIRILNAEDLKTRAERVKFIGRIHHIRALKRSATGRIRALEVVGGRDRFVLEGDKAITDFLSPGSLRSMMFTIQPLMKGASASHFILWGAGTGNGLGMCIAGALGQASLGRTWPMILAQYFPNLKFETPASKAKVAATGKIIEAAKKHKLNPRLKLKKEKERPRR